MTSGTLFFVRMFSYAHPIVDLRAFANRNFALGCLFSFILGIGLYGAVYVIPVMLAQVRGFNALQIGTVMAVTGAFQFGCAPLVGRLSAKLDLRVLLAFGLALFAVGLLVNIRNTSQVGFDELFWPQAIRGVALMFCMVPVNALALATLPPPALKNASALFNLTRNLGGAIGLAAIGTALDTRTDLHFARLADHLNVGRAEVRAALDGLAARLDGLVAADPSLAASRKIVGIVQREAALMAFNDIFVLMAAVFLGALLLMPLLRRPRPGPPGGGH